MPTQVQATAFWSHQHNSSSLKLTIIYPSQIPNLAYNFQLRLQLFKQNLLPRISYEKVHQEKFMLPKKEILINSLQQAKMYKVVVEWQKKGVIERENICDSRTLFFCSEKRPESDQEGQQGEQFMEEISESKYDQFVKGNIQGYFDQYYQNNQSNIKSKPSNTSSKHSNQSFSKKPTQKLPKPNRPASITLCNSQSIIKAIAQNDPFIQKNNIQKYILQGRTSKSIKDYLTTKDYQCFNACSKIYKNEVERRKHVEKTLLVSKAVNMFGEIYSFQKEYGNAGGETFVEKDHQGKTGKQFFKNDWFMGPFYSYNQNQQQMKSKQTNNN